MRVGAHATPLGSCAANIINSKHGRAPAGPAQPAWSPEDFFAANQDFLVKRNKELQESAAARRPQRAAASAAPAPEWVLAKRGALPQGGHQHERQRNAVKASMLAQPAHQVPTAIGGGPDSKKQRGPVDSTAAGAPPGSSGMVGRRASGSMVASQGYSGRGGSAERGPAGASAMRAAPGVGALHPAAPRSPRRGVVNLDRDRKLLPYSFSSQAPADAAWGGALAEDSLRSAAADAEPEGVITRGPGASALRGGALRGGAPERVEPSAPRKHRLLLAAGWKISVAAAPEWGGAAAAPQFDGRGERTRWVSPAPERISYFGLDTAWAAFQRARAEAAGTVARAGGAAVDDEDEEAAPAPAQQIQIAQGFGERRVRSHVPGGLGAREGWTAAAAYPPVGRAAPAARRGGGGGAAEGGAAGDDGPTRLLDVGAAEAPVAVAPGAEDVWAQLGGVPDWFAAPAPPAAPRAWEFRDDAGGRAARGASAGRAEALGEGLGDAPRSAAGREPQAQPQQAAPAGGGLVFGGTAAGGAIRTRAVSLRGGASAAPGGAGAPAAPAAAQAGEGARRPLGQPYVPRARPPPGAGGRSSGAEGRDSGAAARGAAEVRDAAEALRGELSALDELIAAAEADAPPATSRARRGEAPAPAAGRGVGSSRGEREAALVDPAGPPEKHGSPRGAAAPASVGGFGARRVGRGLAAMRAAGQGAGEGAGGAGGASGAVEWTEREWPISGGQGPACSAAAAAAAAAAEEGAGWSGRAESGGGTISVNPALAHLLL